MDFSFDTEQLALRDAVRSLLDAHAPAPEIGAEGGIDAGLWAQLAQMGILGLPFAQQYDGMAAGPVEVMLVAQEIGRKLAPAPFIDTVIIAGGLIDAAGSPAQREEYLPRISGGGLHVVLAHAEPRALWSNAAFGVVATEHDGHWSLSGVKEPISHGANAELLIVSALVGDQTKLFVVAADQDGVGAVSLGASGGHAARLTFNDAMAEPLGDQPAPASCLETVFGRAIAALCAEALGAMEVALDLTVDYLKSRKQFGVPLKTFQALTHRAADMYVSLELTRSTTGFATMALMAEPVDASAASRAKLQMSRAGRHIGKEAIQLHGGIGMTEEYAVGHYVKRLVAIDHTLGDGAFHLRRLAATIEDHAMVDLLG